MADGVIQLSDRREGGQVQFSLDYKALLIMAEKSPAISQKVMQAAMGKACRAVVRIARVKHKFRTIKGNADKAIRYTFDKKAGEGVVYLDEDKAPYIRYLHEGSGLYGPYHKAFDIFPKNKKMLRFATSPNTALWRPDPYGRFHEGGFTYAFGVTNPGIKKDQFLYAAGDDAQMEIQAIFDSAMNDLANQLNQMTGGA
ncbi:Hypothetical protein LUCI_0783 [Lucifera butyrica]|uniref:Uncharacterized protein n=1 Tax=Lucifera butyrica TaxID=1351585 RepID=A0A498R5U4_9FIRM|nr:hypothetical protein [Lucifera butyrica]VBB05573.1 Hypothetical protein LUCI_0783 [Lucifera butyrica]